MMMATAESFYKDLRTTKDAKRKLEAESKTEAIIVRPRAVLKPRRGRRIADKLKATNPW